MRANHLAASEYIRGGQKSSGGNKTHHNRSGPSGARTFTLYFKNCPTNSRRAGARYRPGTGAARAFDMAGGWTFHELGGGLNPIYVYLCPPGAATLPLRFSLAGLDGDSIRRLRRLRHGEPVPDELLRSLGAIAELEGHFFGASSSAMDRGATARRRG